MCAMLSFIFEPKSAPIFWSFLISMRCHVHTTIFYNFYILISWRKNKSTNLSSTDLKNKENNGEATTHSDLLLNRLKILITQLTCWNGIAKFPVQRILHGSKEHTHWQWTFHMIFQSGNTNLIQTTKMRIQTRPSPSQHLPFRNCVFINLERIRWLEGKHHHQADPFGNSEIVKGRAQHWEPSPTRATNLVQDKQRRILEKSEGFRVVSKEEGMIIM